MIINAIHQVWLGPKTKPEKIMNSWKTKNPGFLFFNWDHDAIELFHLKNKLVYDAFIRIGDYAGACDIARVEILERIGGIYVDADMEAVESIADAPFLQADFFAAYDHETHGWPGRINNAIIGSVMHHEILKDYMIKIGAAKEIRPAWRTIGGAMLTNCINEHGVDSNVRILPAGMFWPMNHDGKVAKVAGKVYSHHLWGTTKNLYGNENN